jgi:hypothetical protein
LLKSKNHLTTLSLSRLTLLEFRKKKRSLVRSTTMTPDRKVSMEESRKHQYCLHVSI